MKILVFGPSGQVGTELLNVLSDVPQTEVVAVARTSEGGDLTDPAAVAARIRAECPAVVFNAAAYTAVDRAEQEPALAEVINAAAPGVMACACREAGAVFVHFSTDYVFDGSGAAAWSENDTTGPLNVYGATKLAGEKAVLASGAAAFVFRTSWVYAAHGHNFVRTILARARTAAELSVVNDQTGTPTSASYIARVSAQLALRAAGGDTGLPGLYHLVPEGSTTWHAFACHIVREARMAGLSLRLREDSIRAVPTVPAPGRAVRPLNSRLACMKLRTVCPSSAVSWRSVFEPVFAELLVQESQA